MEEDKMSLEKITKKTYFELIKDTEHYNCGIQYNLGKNITFEDLQERLEDFDVRDVIEQDCLKCTGAIQNSVDFIHIYGGEPQLHEQKKGTFYRQFIQGILFIFHFYDTTTVSIKAIL